MCSAIFRDLSGIFRDFRDQLSWGRVCAATSLVVAVVLSFQDKPDLPLIATWLGHTFGEYAASKVTEIASNGGKP
jgi:EamA domain-containing membrane protein RarD